MEELTKKTVERILENNKKKENLRNEILKLDQENYNLLELLLQENEKSIELYKKVKEETIKLMNNKKEITEC